MLEIETASDFVEESAGSGSATLLGGKGGSNRNKKLRKFLLLRLFRLGTILFIVSLTTTLVWLVLAWIFNDSNISTAYSLASPMQYVVNLLFGIFSSGACIKKEKEKDDNAIGSGFVFGLVTTFIIFFLLCIFANSYIEYFGFDTTFYRPFVIYSFGFYFVQNAFNMLMQKLYFEDKERRATVFYVIFYALDFFLLVIFSLCTKNFLVSAIITLVLLCIYVGVLAVKILGKFKLKFNILSNLKYTSATIVSSIFMFCIYFFGLQTIYAMGSEYTVALNFVALCMTIPWGCLGAISTAGQVDVSKKRLKYTETVKASYIYAGLLSIIAFGMFFGLFTLYNVDIKIGLIYLAFQLFDYVTWTLLNTLSAFTQLEFSATANTILDLSTKVVRVILSVAVMSPYCTMIGADANAVIAMVGYLFIRFHYYKLEDGVLVRKDMKKASPKGGEA